MKVTRIRITLVTARAALAATIGAMLGTASTWFVLNLLDNPADPAFAVAVAILAILVAAAAALPPAVSASRQDPVQVLRTP